MLFALAGMWWRSSGHYTMHHDDTDGKERRDWLREKAKDVHKLTAEEVSFIDTGISARIKELLTDHAARIWWQQFGSQGYSLETEGDEIAFIAHLDTVLPYPSASDLISPPREARRDYRVIRMGRRASETVTFRAPPPGRLFELMLYGVFDFLGHWVYLKRPNNWKWSRPKDPAYWCVVDSPPDDDRLGTWAFVESRWPWQPKIPVPPQRAFSSLPPISRADFAAMYGNAGNHQEWINGIIDNSYQPKSMRPAITVRLLGEGYDIDAIPLADLIAGAGKGQRSEPLDGNLLNCRPENLRVKTKAGRKMLCKICEMPTTAADSTRLKDRSGTSVRVCVSCQREMR